MGEFDILKYPRTQHLQGSRLQKGDEDLSQIPFSYIKDRHIVIEEKIDGANTAISFNDNSLARTTRETPSFCQNFTEYLFVVFACVDKCKQSLGATCFAK